MEILTTVFDWLLESATVLFNMVASWSWLGASLIGLGLLRRVVRVIRKVY